MYGSMSTEVLKQRREEMLGEADLDRLVRVSRAGPTGPTVGIDGGLGDGESCRPPA